MYYNLSTIAELHSLKKSTSDAPSVWISFKSDNVSVCMLALLSILITFIEEKILSTRPLETGKLNSKPHKSNTLDHFEGSSTTCNLYVPYLVVIIYFAEDFFSILNCIFNFIKDADMSPPLASMVP